MSYSSTSGVSLNNIQLKCLQNRIFTAQLGTKSPHHPPREKKQTKKCSYVNCFDVSEGTKYVREDKQHVQQEEKNVLKETLSDPNTGCCELLERGRKKAALNEAQTHKDTPPPKMHVVCKVVLLYKWDIYLRNIHTNPKKLGL